MTSCKRWVVLPLLLLAMGAAGWLRQWPVSLSQPDAGAYRIELTEAVYRSAHDADLRDVAVIDANDQPVPAMLFAADTPAAGKAQQVGVPWFALPDAAELPSSELRVISERATDGRVLRVETRDITDARAPQSWLVDASALRSPVRALRLGLRTDAQVEARLRVEGSDDLMDWRVLTGDVGILQVTRDGQTLGQTRVPLPQSALYLRMTQTGGEPLPLTAVNAEIGPAAPVAARQSRDYAPSEVAKDRRSFEFSVDGLQPFDQADVVLPGNSAVSWRLESRDSAETPWQLRAGPWAQYRIGDGQNSRPQLLAPIRQRQWRLVSDVAVAETPKLRLSWQPEVLMFVASGNAPYRVVAGSVQHQRQDAPLGDLLAGIRANRGADWQPAIATIQGEGEAGDPDALRVPHDWKNYALWGVLLLAALLVIGFAVSLLRGRGDASRADEDQGPPPDAG
ncbi:MAG: DUF3999 domain-containing protein [Xanthomonadaceae bacterium]|nr:DUF3999 domain-containing protein [Xanthomonadaceae bacterium]